LARLIDQEISVRTLGRILLGLIALVVLAAVVLLAKGSYGLGKVRDIPARPIAVVADSAAVLRGKHLAESIMKCVDCHGEDLGGRIVADAGPLGSVYATNLTRGQGGKLERYDDAAIARAIRHGVTVEGRPIHIMPADNYSTASDRDVAAVIAYLRSVPPVDRVLPPTRVKLLGRVLYGAGMFPIVDADRIDHEAQPSGPIDPAPTVEYGGYLGAIGGCTGCHGPGLSGGKIPGTPPDWKPASNITPAGLSGWKEDDFRRALTTGVRPNGTPIDSIMPWRATALMDSTEFRALWLFLQSVPPKPYGGR
jgi:mono/diheme cytochrome c family protein